MENKIKHKDIIPASIQEKFDVIIEKANKTTSNKEMIKLINEWNQVISRI